MRGPLIALVTAAAWISHAQAQSTGGSDPQPSAGGAVQLEEVIVTAQKRDERLQDVPIPLSVISADSLVDTNKLALVDFYTEVPGLTVAALGSGLPPVQTVVIRGLSAVGGTQTSAVSVDDVPVLSSTSTGSGFLPDIDPASLSHIEVLRGPQGTLYGANSLGGLVKYVTLEPSTREVSGHVTAGTQAIDGAANLGYTLRGAINLPLGGDWAMRMSAFSTKEPGYIDDPAIRSEGINALNSDGGHLAVLWKPSDTLSLRLTAILQKTYADAITYSDLVPNPADLAPYTFPAPVGYFQQVHIKLPPYETKGQIYGAELKYRIGSLDLTAVSGYVVNSFDDSVDFSFANGITKPIFAGVPGLQFQSAGKNDQFSQEIRLSGPITTQLDFLLGGFYTHQDFNFRGAFPATDPLSGAVAGVWGQDVASVTYSEYAGFANLTYRPTTQFAIQVGLRGSQIRQTSGLTCYNVTPLNPTGGLLTFNELFCGSPDPVHIAPEQRSDNNAVTYLVTPSYKISKDVMAYIRVASGYRPGVANTVAPGVPPTSQPDKTTDYDLGLKASFLDSRLSVDVSAYYIDWKNIQLTLYGPYGGYTANAGRAKSQGIEVFLEGRPVPSLKLTGWVDWDEAVLREGFPLEAGLATHAGDPLPWVPRFSAHVSADQEFPLSGALRGFVGAEVSYVGDRKDYFPVPPSVFGTPGIPRLDNPAYTKVDLRGGVRVNAWTVNIYANNVTNKVAINQGGVGEGQTQVLVITPRTIGVNITRSF